MLFQLLAMGHDIFKTYLYFNRTRYFFNFRLYLVWGNTRNYLRFQLWNLASELVDDVSVLRYMVLNVENVPLNISLNVFSTISIFQGVMGIFVVLRWWGNIRNHHCSAVSSQRVLQQSCQFRVSKWDIVSLTFWVVLVKHVDTITKSKKWLVNVCTFNHSDTSISCFGCSLRACQIYKR